MQKILLVVDGLEVGKVEVLLSRIGVVRGSLSRHACFGLIRIPLVGLKIENWTCSWVSEQTYLLRTNQDPTG